MVFYSLVSLLLPFWPHLSQSIPQLAPYLSYPAVKSLMHQLCVSIQSAPIFCYVLSSLSAPVILPAPCFSSIFSHLSVLTCSLFRCSSRLWSLLHTSSILSWDNTSGALMLLSSSLSEFSPFSSSAPLYVVWFSSVDRDTWLKRIWSLSELQ